MIDQDTLLSSSFYNLPYRLLTDLPIKLPTSMTSYLTYPVQLSAMAFTR